MTTLPRGRALTVDDIEAMPDDGNCYELIDGVLVVTPAPGTRHQRAVLNLWRLLDEAAPDNMWAMAAPYDVILDHRTWVEPDVLVARKADFDDKRLAVPPLLAVEVLSPHSVLTDLNVKHDRYRRAGIPSYWVVDPAVPRVIAWELSGTAYVEVADVAAGESWTATLPFPVTVVPRHLID
jgi:Uma2 family endonuclease